MDQLIIWARTADCNPLGFAGISDDFAIRFRQAEALSLSSSSDARSLVAILFVIDVGVSNGELFTNDLT